MKTHLLRFCVPCNEAKQFFAPLLNTYINQSPFKSCLNLLSKKLVFFVSSKLEVETWCKKLLMLHQIHTAGSDTIFIQTYMDAPPEVTGVSKEPEGHKEE